MYKIKVLHNYIYKLVEELQLAFPQTGFQVRNDAIITSDPKIVEAAKYIFQFQPGLLVIKHSLTSGIEIEKDEFSLERIPVLVTEI